MKIVLGYLVLFVAAMIVLSEAMPMELLELMKKSEMKKEHQEKQARRSEDLNIMRLLSARAGGAVRSGVCSWMGMDFGEGEVVYRIEDEARRVCHTATCGAGGDLLYTSKVTCVVTQPPVAPVETTTGLIPQFG